MERIQASDITGSLEELNTEIDLRVVSLEALKKTCYRFSDSYYAGLTLNKDGDTAFAKFAIPGNLSEEDRDALLHRFHRDALDQELREIVFKKTETVRNLILMNAFANTDLVEE